MLLQEGILNDFLIFKSTASTYGRERSAPLFLGGGGTTSCGSVRIQRGRARFRRLLPSSVGRMLEGLILKECELI
jgi:hypothetical protein